MIVTLKTFTPNPLQVIEEAACECYQSTPDPDSKHVHQCFFSGHHSVLEHVSFTFQAIGISRACLAQLTRHRLVSFSVESQRYVNYEQGLPFRMPDSIKNNPQAADRFSKAMGLAHAAYVSLLDVGIPKEDARFVLPNATTCNVTFTMNLRELIHMCNERLCSRAQWEIRELVSGMVEEVNKATGKKFSYMLQPKCLSNPLLPLCVEGKRSCGRAPTVSRYIESEPKEEH